MPQKFDGDTYVAYCDLSGFKQMQDRDRKKAAQALEQLFQFTRKILDNRDRLLKTEVDAIGISDCIISWARDRKLDTLVSFLRQLHSQMIRKRYLLRTTIAYGDFWCHGSPGLSNLQVTCIAGKAYTSAYLANVDFEPGMIVLLKTSRLPRPTGWRWHLTKRTGNCEYFWSARQKRDIQRIEQERTKARNIKYRRLIEIYQGRLQPARTTTKSPRSTRKGFF